MDKKITVGIITMHKVLNQGSALQTYALQEAIEQLGYTVEIIDYLYPNLEHQLYWELPAKASLRKASLLLRIKGKVSNLYHTLWREKATNNATKFASFYHSFYHLTPMQYATRYELGKNPPHYDIYLTGSDQVWNPKDIGYDTSFMLSFVRGANPKLSYASSFAIGNLPTQFEACYRHELKQYSYITVREKAGSDIIKKLTGKEVDVVCDPTLLLSKKEWMKVADASDCRIEGPYILIFVLDYAYDPYPSIFDIIEKVHRKLNHQMIVLHGRMSDYMKAHQTTIIENAGPSDFLKLFSNASFIITTSFHGTAFSINFNIPFFSIVKDTGKEDSRMYGLLKIVKAENRALIYNQTEYIPDELLYHLEDKIREALISFRTASWMLLKNSLIQAVHQLNNKTANSH